MRIKNRKLESRNWKFENGIASLATTLLLGSVIIEIGLAIALIAYVLNQGSVGTRLSAQAFANAHSGIEDGLIRLLRNYDENYTLSDEGTILASVTVSDLVGGKKRIESIGQALGLIKKRKLVAVVELDLNSGLMRIESISEEPL